MKKTQILKNYEFVFVDYIGYNYDSDEEPRRCRVYPATRVTEALRKFKDDYPLYEVDKINIITEK